MLWGSHDIVGTCTLIEGSGVQIMFWGALCHLRSSLNTGLSVVEPLFIFLLQTVQLLNHTLSKVGNPYKCARCIYYKQLIFKGLVPVIVLNSIEHDGDVLWLASSSVKLALEWDAINHPSWVVFQSLGCALLSRTGHLKLLSTLLNSLSNMLVLPTELSPWEVLLIRHLLFPCRYDFTFSQPHRWCFSEVETKV